MTNQRIKYSIMIPSYNGGKYLPSCVSTIISQDYSDYELIISDDHSTDETNEYLKSLIHPNITILRPDSSMSMSEHWEWILSHAQGDWCIFVGQDDGVQSYFFELADILTRIAEKKGIKAIASARAYYSWPDYSLNNFQTHVNYQAFPKISFFNSRMMIFVAIFEKLTYFELPQMYTTSLLHKSIIAEAMQKQSGKVFCTHPQDANLAAVSCSLNKSYLYSYIPIGWVGTSRGSAGLAIGSEENTNLKQVYIKKINKSKLKYYERAGDFSIGSTVLYFWAALATVDTLNSKLFTGFITSRFFTYMVFCFAKLDLHGQKKAAINTILESVIKINKLNKLLLFILYPISAVINFVLRCCSKIYRKTVKLLNIFSVLSINILDSNNKSMLDTSNEIKNLLDKKKYFNKLILQYNI